jgi:predicted MPP superfamily phosphohydrolase
VETIVDLINSQKCDAIVFTGDLVNYQARETDGYRRNLSKLQAPDGVFAIMGNHDYSMYIKTLTPEMVRADIAELQRRERSYGWQLLLNENRVLHRGNDSIAIIGVENDGEFPFPSLGDLPKACKGLQGVMRNKNAKTPAGHTFSILLTHDPTHWRRNVLPETRIDLSLAGHTHAGQFKVFGWSPVALRYKEWSGIYTECSQVLNVNEGIGGVMFPFRFGAWPELTVITLRKGNR